jgi:UDP-N-acetylmuramyl tripeptide synthase
MTKAVRSYWVCRYSSIDLWYKGDADVNAKNIEITAEGVFMNLFLMGEKYPVFYTPGLFSVYNSLAAITTGIAMGFPIDRFNKCCLVMLRDSR